MDESHQALLFENGEVPMLEDARYIPVLVLGCVSSILSVIGSSCIAYMTWQANVRTKVMQRLLFCLSVSDFLSSFSLLIMPFLIPSLLGLPGSALGSFASCSGIGFIFLVSTKMGCCYNAYLSIYYYLVVVRNWREYDFRQRQPQLEWTGHIVAIGLSLAIETAAVVTQTINPTPLINNLFIYAAWPWGCTDLDDLECTRSSNTTFLLITALNLPTFLIFSVVGFITAALVFAKVRSTLLKSSQYVYRFQNKKGNAPSSSQYDYCSGEATTPPTGTRTSTGTTNSNTTTTTTTTPQSTATITDPHTARIQEVGIQAVLYALAYFQSFFWPLMVIIMSQRFTDSETVQKKLEPGFYALTVLFWVFYPLQGFFNFFIYTRVKIKRWRTAEPDKSILWIYQQIVSGVTPPTSSSSTAASRITTRYQYPSKYQHHHHDHDHNHQHTTTTTTTATTITKLSEHQQQPPSSSLGQQTQPRQLQDDASANPHNDDDDEVKVISSEHPPQLMEEPAAQPED